MFRAISDKMPQLPGLTPRGRALLARDKFIEGTFYDHLSYDFYAENDDSGYVPIIERRPSVQYNLPRRTALSCARKLFSTRHVPRFALDGDPELLAAINTLVAATQLRRRMLNIAFHGSIGSVAVTFTVSKREAGRVPAIDFDVWRGWQCAPSFDNQGELAKLRVCVPTKGGKLGGTAFESPRDSDGEEIESESGYWVVRDYLPDREVNYMPVAMDGLEDAESPFVSDAKLKEFEDREPVVHGLGFVPGHWFVNLTGGDPPDGAATWEAAKNIAIEIDYTASQLGRGIRYNAAPQLVVQGRLINASLGNRLVRSPSHVLQFDATRKEYSGEVTQGGDAKLLEMTGGGINSGLEYLKELRKLALEAIAMSRKDPDKLSAAQSGIAMMLIDEDYVDLADELMTNYGECGYLPLTKKLVIAAAKFGHPLFKSIDALDELALNRPRVYPPGAGELMQLSTAFHMFLEDKVIDREQAEYLLDGQIDLPIKRAPLATDIEAGAPAPKPVEVVSDGAPAAGGTDDQAPAANAPEDPMLRRMSQTAPVGLEMRISGAG